MASKFVSIIIGVSGGLALGISIASVVFFGIKWCKRRTHCQQHANRCSPVNLPIRINGLGTSTEFSVPLATITGESEHPQRSSQPSRWSHHNRDQFASLSNIIRYSYKDIQKATLNFTTVIGQGSFGPVYKAVMSTGEVLAVKVLASNSGQGEKEFQTEVRAKLTTLTVEEGIS
uniref:Protein kinase domain-containing protein n=1 Tax=Rhizophora mucronata TaxID=61149 RepID=A0A2P2MWE7_RHIMU